MSEIKEYYVYLHMRGDDGSIFYIGKGVGRRAFVVHGRSRHWKRVSDKHGHVVEFYATGLSNACAKSVEAELISRLRADGVKLVNITDGGDGGLGKEDYAAETRKRMRDAKIGRKQSIEHAKKSASAKLGRRQPRGAVEYVSQLKRKPVINSNGEIFSSTIDAAKRMAARTGLSISPGNISSSCSGKRLAYGMAWSFDIERAPKVKKMKFVCSNGLEFSSAREAASWVSTARGKASPSNITNSVRTGGMAYGFNWHVVEDRIDEIS